MHRGAFLFLLILGCLITATGADISKQELQKWVDDSTLIFTGTIVSLDSNVDSIDASDDPITVKVDRIESGNAEALKNFGSLVGERLTVVVDRGFKLGPQRRLGVSAVFFVNPLLYEKHIAVTAHAVGDVRSVKNLSKRLRGAIEEKKKAPLNLAVNSANPVVTGVVQEVKALSDEKVAKLELMSNGRDLYSEHGPRWREAVIRVQSVLKGDQREKMLLVVFPSTDDLMWSDSPKFVVGQSGIWLLHSGTQLSEQRAKILLGPEPFDGSQLKAYTALRPEDFQLKDSAGKNEALIREILKSPKQ